MADSLGSCVCEFTSDLGISSYLLVSYVEWLVFLSDWPSRVVDPCSGSNCWDCSVSVSSEVENSEVSIN